MQPGGSEIFSVACELFAVAHVGTFLTRVQTQTPCIGGSECQPLDHQGSALNFLSFDASLCIFISQPHPQHTHTHTPLSSSIEQQLCLLWSGSRHLWVRV